MKTIFQYEGKLQRLDSQGYTAGELMEIIGKILYHIRPNSNISINIKIDDEADKSE